MTAALTDAGRLRLLEIYEREGLLPALVEGARVLDGQGLDKYGVQGWRGVPTTEMREKVGRHIQQRAPDAESGQEPAAHAMIRCAQICTRALEGGEP